MVLKKLHTKESDEAMPHLQNPLKLKNDSNFFKTTPNTWMIFSLVLYLLSAAPLQAEPERLSHSMTNELKNNFLMMVPPEKKDAESNAKLNIEYSSGYQSELGILEAGYYRNPQSSSNPLWLLQIKGCQPNDEGNFPCAHTQLTQDQANQLCRWNKTESFQGQANCMATLRRFHHTIAQTILGPKLSQKNLETLETHEERLRTSLNSLLLNTYKKKNPHLRKAFFYITDIIFDEDHIQFEVIPMSRNDGTEQYTETKTLRNCFLQETLFGRYLKVNCLAADTSYIHLLKALTKVHLPHPEYKNAMSKDITCEFQNEDASPPICENESTLE